MKFGSGTNNSGRALGNPLRNVIMSHHEESSRNTKRHSQGDTDKETSQKVFLCSWSIQLNPWLADTCNGHTPSAIFGHLPRSDIRHTRLQWQRDDTRERRRGRQATAMTTGNDYSKGKSTGKKSTNDTNACASCKAGPAKAPPLALSLSLFSFVLIYYR